MTEQQPQEQLGRWKLLGRSRFTRVDIDGNIEELSSDYLNALEARVAALEAENAALKKRLIRAF